MTASPVTERVSSAIPASDPLKTTDDEALASTEPKKSSFASSTAEFVVIDQLPEQIKPESSQGEVQSDVAQKALETPDEQNEEPALETVEVRKPKENEYGSQTDPEQSTHSSPHLSNASDLESIESVETPPKSEASDINDKGANDNDGDIHTGLNDVKKEPEHESSDESSDEKISDTEQVVPPYQIGRMEIEESLAGSSTLQVGNRSSALGSSQLSERELERRKIQHIGKAPESRDRKSSSSSDDEWHNQPGFENGCPNDT